MSKKVVNGIEVSDDIPVTEYDGKFSGSFELDVEKAASMAYDDTVYFVVTTVLDKYAFTPTKYGDLKRTNTFKVDSVRVVKTDELNKMHQNTHVSPAVEYEQITYTDSSPEEEIDPEVFEPDVDDDEVFVPEPRRRETNEPYSSATQDLPNNGRNYSDPILRQFLDVG